jgi:hypothetical protein
VIFGEYGGCEASWCTRIRAAAFSAEGLNRKQGCPRGREGKYCQREAKCDHAHAALLEFAGRAGEEENRGEEYPLPKSDPSLPSSRIILQ